MRLDNLIKWILILTLTVLTLSSCSEINATNPKEAYNYWAGTKPPNDIEFEKAKYWQSSHMTREYIMYLKFKPTKIWWEEFLVQNSLPIDTRNWTLPSEAPDWFKPSHTSIRYGGNCDFDQGSRYFRDSITGVCYIYEIQL